MSVKVMAAIWESAVPAPERFTLLALADNADDTGLCWPSIATIGRKVRLHESTVQRHLHLLVEQGLLERQLRAGHSTMYRVVIEALPVDDPPADCDPPQIATPRKSRPHPPAICDPTPPQIATQNHQEPSGNHHTPARGAGEADALVLGLPSKPDPLRGFDAFWRAYPKKVSKDDARKAWRQKITGPGQDPDRIAAAARAHAERWRAEKREHRYMPYPATWLRDGSYDDEPPTETSSVPDPAVTGKRRIQC